MPTRSLIETAPAPETVIDGRRYVYFGGTGYLGLAADPQVLEAGCAAMRRYGVHSATSRAVCTSPPVQEAEQLAAQFFGKEDAFYFTSGYMGNHILVRALADEVDTILLEQGAHYSVEEACRLARKPIRIFSQSEPGSLERCAQDGARVLLMANAVSPAMGTLAPVEYFFRVLRLRSPSTLVLDDAHGFGVLGERGRGLLEAAGLWNLANSETREGGVKIAVCGTLAKALGGFGGIIPGSGRFIARLRTSSHYFDGASAPPAAIAAASVAALELVIREPERRARLRANALEVRRALRALGLQIPEGQTAHFGVCIGDAHQMRHISDSLRQRGVFVPYLAHYVGLPPEGLLRVAVFATHTAEHIERLATEIRRLL